jgi:hypothetical protein
VGRESVMIKELKDNLAMRLGQGKAKGNIHLITFQGTRDGVYHADYIRCISYFDSNNIPYEKANYPRMDWETSEVEIHTLLITENYPIENHMKDLESQLDIKRNHHSLMISSELIFLKQNVLHVLPGEFFKNWDEIQRYAKLILGDGKWLDIAYLLHVQWRMKHRSSSSEWSGGFGSLLFALCCVSYCRGTKYHSKGHYMMYEYLGIDLKDFEREELGINGEIFRRSFGRLRV